MKIWLIMEGEELPIDGAGTRLLRVGILARMLEDKGHEIVWWASTFSHARKIFRYNKDTSIDLSDRYQIHMLHARPYKKNISFDRILHQKEVAEKFAVQAPLQRVPNVILVGMPTIELAQKAVEYGNMNNVPVLVDLRDAWPDNFTEYFPRFIAPLIKLGASGMNLQLCKTLSKADGLIGMSELFLRWGLEKADRSINAIDRVFPLGYPDASNDTTPSDICDKIGVSPDGFTVVLFGTIAYSSNLEHVVKAARLISSDENIQFVFCGSGNMLERIREEAKDLPHVFVPGRIDKGDIISLAKAASAGIITYQKKSQYSMGFPNKFAEYLCFGLPILLYTDGAMKEYVDKYACGISYDSPSELAEQIRFLKNNPKQRIEMSKSARRLYKEKFEAEKVYGNMIDYLESLGNCESPLQRNHIF